MLKFWFCGLAPDLSEHYDAVLQLELAEHALLWSMGWSWHADGNEFVWVAPANHRGSQRRYTTRQHAINSVKRHHLGLGRDTYSRKEWNEHC